MSRPSDVPQTSRNPDATQSASRASLSQGVRPLPSPESHPKRQSSSFLWKMWSLSSTVILLLMILTGIALLGLIRAARRSTVDPIIHEQYTASLHSLLTLDSTLNQSVLKASAGFLPNFDPLAGPTPVLSQQVEELLRQVSLFTLQPLPEHKRAVEDQLTILANHSPPLQPQLDEDLHLVMGHARIVLDRQRRIDSAIREILRFPTQAQADDARRTYERHFHAALSTADLYRTLIAALGVLLVVLSASLVILKLRRSSMALEQERQLAEKLLLNVLPKPIADRLKQTPDVIADHFPTVTVLFADLVGFSQLSAKLPAIELVRMLNRIFSALDLVTEKYQIEKIKTIGDAYMVVSGLPIFRPDHAEVMAEFALAALAEIERIRSEREENLQFRIGINTGPVVAGVIGVRKFAYDLWGDTVNVASRMEMHGVPGEIQCSESTYELLKHRYEFTSRGTIAVKGIGPMQTYYLHRRKAD